MEFKNATIIKKANIYFDGKVTSRTLYTERGEKKAIPPMGRATPLSYPPIQSIN